MTLKFPDELAIKAHLGLLHDAVTKRFLECIDYFLPETDSGTEFKFDVNFRVADGGHTPLHVAARKPDLPLMAILIRRGADPLLINSMNRSALQYVSIHALPPSLSTIPNTSNAVSSSSSVSNSNTTTLSLDSEKPISLVAGLSGYINSPSLSDVTIVLDSGEKFFGHRIVFCSQSSVFKTMFDQGAFFEASNREVILSDMSPTTMKILLTYLYSGSASFVRDDLNTGVALLRAASRFMIDPLRDYCERILSTRVYDDSVIGLYQAASFCEANFLLATTQHYLLANYSSVFDRLSQQNHPDSEGATKHATLLHLLDNAKLKKAEMKK